MRYLLPGRYVSIGMLCTVIAACSMTDIVGEPAVREGAGNNADAARSASGALAFYNGVIYSHGLAFDEHIVGSGLVTDELGAVWKEMTADVRRISNTVSSGLVRDGSFGLFNGVRLATQQGRGLLLEYLPNSPPALQGHLYALEGFSNIMLAELFCSGIPLGRLTYDGKSTANTVFSSDQIYEMAIALFDSAIAISSDSARIVQLAQVGKARALLNLGRFNEAAAAVADVPTDFRYTAIYGATEATRNAFYRPTATSGYAITASPDFSVRSSEGVNGLPYATSGDWRTDTAHVNISQPEMASYRVRVAQKYAASGATPIILASGVEARLIEAEADLRAGNPRWLATLNSLRATCTPTSNCSPVLVNVGSVSALPEIPEITVAAEQVDTLFKERAAWLYLTGHRQGDLRRMIRQYSRLENTVYPVGPYSVGPGVSFELTRYGSDVTLPAPEFERQNNNTYSGCASRGA